MGAEPPLPILAILTILPIVVPASVWSRRFVAVQPSRAVPGLTGSKGLRGFDSGTSECIFHEKHRTRTKNKEEQERRTKNDDPDPLRLQRACKRNDPNNSFNP